jgi:glycosyltransferase involved in cell wall biosynthesis
VIALARRIHWLSWHPTPYNDYLFEALAKNQLIDLLVHYISPTLTSHPWKSSFGKTYRTRFCRLLGGIDWHLLSLIFRDRRAYFLVASWNHPASQVLLTLLRLFNRSYGIWTDTPNIHRRRHSLKARVRALWLHWIFSGASHILGTGKPAIEALQEMGAPPARLVNFPFYIDLSTYKYADNAAVYEDRPLRFLSSGRLLNSVKGHDVAIRALALVASQLDMPFEYYIAGTGPDKEHLMLLAKEQKVLDRLKFLDWMEPGELLALYREVDVLIHPSPVHDPFPNAILEGMAAGLVVLGSDASGSAVDRIEHGLNGFIHRAGDVNALAKQVLFLLHNPRCIETIGKHARATAELWPVQRAVDTVINMISYKFS